MSTNFNDSTGIINFVKLTNISSFTVLLASSNIHAICICYSTGRSDIWDIFHEL